MEHMITPSTIQVTEYLKEHYTLSEVLFFDIETTGFSAKTSYLYLIGCLYFQEGAPKIKQWFAETPSDEPVLLFEFFEFLKNFKYLIHYNGNGFDIPYLMQKCAHYNLSYNFESIKSVDLYKILSPFKSLLKLENLKQKTVENYLGISRKDVYNGGELISVYLEYIKKPDKQGKELLLLHNHDDINGLLCLSPMLAFQDFILDNLKFQDAEIKDYVSYNGLEGKEIIFTFHLSSPLPKRVSFAKQDHYLSISKQECKLRVKAYTGELKYFYSDYKNYYYLPKEDTAIHKSVAFYVDKDFRTKAKAANCYSKKTGVFLPQFQEIVSPYFKIDYFDKILYFEACSENLTNNDLMLTYIYHILQLMLK
ncbi:MAG: ribonuclease H-like domain-containing protein [Lachnospiraceae bacterium]|nr:ribonuclease H-like domain-containing protein [Lachnospiraceae bacterium]